MNGCEAGGVSILSFVDKATYPARRFTAESGIRIVPGGSSIRSGAHLAKGVVMMPPAYVNVGAFVGEDTMIDSHALVGSCAQIGARVHLSAAAQIGGTGMTRPNSVQHWKTSYDSFGGRAPFR